MVSRRNRNDQTKCLENVHRVDERWYDKLKNLRNLIFFQLETNFTEDISKKVDIDNIFLQESP